MAYPSDLVRTKNWGSEVLTDSDLEGQFDLIINWVMAALNASTGHSHSGSGNNGPRLASSAVTTTFGNGFTTVTAASGDYVMVATDVSDSNTTKKALVSDIVTLAAPVAASQAEQETGSSTTVMVTPGRQQYHPSAAKAWIKFDGTGSTPITFDAGYGISGTTIAKDATGTYTITWGTAFSSENYCVVGNGKRSGATTLLNMIVSTQSTTACQVVFRNQSDVAEDTKIGCIVAFGDQ